MAEFTNATGYVGNGTEWIPFDGGGEEPVASMAVVTHQPTDVGAETATFEGELTSLGEYSSAEVFFEWREPTSSSWHEIASRARSAPTTYSYDLGDILDPETEYEYRAVAEADGNRVTGSSVTFETDSADVVIADNFESNVDSAWEGSSEWGTTTQVAWSGSYAAYRSGPNSLRAGPYTFDRTFEQGGRFLAMPVHATDTGIVTFDFGRDNSSTLAGYTVRINWQGSDSGLLTVGHRETTEADYVTLGSQSVPISQNQWYEAIILWHEDDSIHVWLYDSSGTEVGVVEVNGVGESGDWWAIYAAPTESVFVDYVRFLETHLYTFDHYTDISAAHDNDLEESPYDYVEPFSNTSWQGGTFGDVWDRGVGTNTTIRDVSGRAGNQMEATVREDDGGYGFDTSHAHQSNSGYEPTTCYHRFWIKFDPNWGTAINHDGKLPGFAGTEGTDEGDGGTPSAGTGWSAKMGWRNPADVSSGDIELMYYIYHMDASGNYGDHEPWNVVVEPDTWYEIEQYIELGTAGSSDGVLRGWVNGTLEFEMTGIHWRNSGGNDINYSNFLVYHGGSGTTPDHDITVAFDDFAITLDGMPE